MTRRVAANYADRALARQQRRAITDDDRRRLDALFDRAIAPPPPIEYERCTWCNGPIVRWSELTCSNTTYHGDGTSTAVIWHVGCLGPP